MRAVYVAGIGMSRFGKQLDRSLKDLSSEAVSAACEDAQIPPQDLQACFFANAVAGAITGQEMVAGQVTLRPLGLRQIPIYNVENACASASTAFHLAWLGVASGLVDIALAVGAEKLTHQRRSQTFEAIGRAVDVENAPRAVHHDRSPFMDLYAKQATEYMERTGATPEDFALVAVKNHRNGKLNDKAQYGSDLTIQDVLRARQVVWPLTLYMCSPIGDGAAAAILASREALHNASRGVRVAASVVVSGVPGRDGTPKSTAIAARKAYDQAGIGPEDLDCAEVHDAAASAEVSLYEELGLGATGEGPRLIRDAETNLDGKVPVNTSGGLLARGHPIGATGLAQIHEAVLQARGDAGPRQVSDARVVLTQNAGGWLDDDNAVCVIHVLVRDTLR